MQTSSSVYHTEQQMYLQFPEIYIELCIIEQLLLLLRLVLHLGLLQAFRLPFRLTSRTLETCLNRGFLTFMMVKFLFNLFGYLTHDKEDTGLFTYGNSHPMKPYRMRMTHNLVAAYGMLQKMTTLVSK